MTRLYSSISTETTLSSGINTTQTTMQVPSSDAASALLGGVTLAAGNVDIFTVVIDPDTINEEIVFITDRSGDTFTISRGQAGTGTAGVSGIAHSAGATIRHVLTSSDLIYFRNGVVTADAAVPKSTLAAKGNILTATAASTPSGLSVGTNGQYLKADSTTATGLAWGTPSSTPKIGQVVTTSVTPNVTTTSTSFVDVTGVTATITPTLSTSKILVLCSYLGYVQGNMGANSGGALSFGYYQIVRGSTGVFSNSLGWYSGSLSTNDFLLTPQQNIMYLDSPATTSATTYKLQVRSNGSSVTSGSSGNATITLLEVLV